MLFIFFEENIKGVVQQSIHAAINHRKLRSGNFAVLGNYQHFRNPLYMTTKHYTTLVKLEIY